MPVLDLDRLATELRKRVALRDDHVRAAVQLLTDHDYWLHHGRFTRAAVVKAQDGSFARRRAAKLVNDWRVFFGGATISVDTHEDDGSRL